MRRNIIIGICIVFLLILATIYFFFLGGQAYLFKKTPPANNTPPADQSKAPPRPQEQKVMAISQKSVLGPILSLKQESVWYFDVTGQLYSNTLDGSKEESYNLTDFKQGKKIIWPITGNDFIVQLAFATSTAPNFRVYQALEKKFVDLKANVQSVDWLADGKRIVYVWKSGDGKLSLKVSDSDGENFATVLPLQSLYELKASPIEDKVLLYQPNSLETFTPTLLADLRNATTTELLNRGKNVEVKFSPDGQKLLFTRVNPDTNLPEVWLHNFQNKTFTNLNIVTGLSKVGWNSLSDKFYFGLPAQAQAGDYLMMGKTSDAIYVYDINSGLKTQVLAGPENASYDVRDVLVNKDESIVLFRNGFDGKLYRVKVK